MIKPNPFTPKSGLEPKVFINREKEIKFFLKRINEAKNGKVTENHWKRGFEEGLFYLGNTVYDGIAKGISDNEIKIIRKFNPEKLNKIADLKNKINIKSLNEYLRRLLDKNILEIKNRGEYYIKDRILWEYLNRKSQ